GRLLPSVRAVQRLVTRVRRACRTGGIWWTDGRSRRIRSKSDRRQARGFSMFTGIVSAIGTITSVDQRGDLRITIACPYDPANIAIGASIACSGVCLTVVDRGGKAGDAWFAVDV